MSTAHIEWQSKYELGIYAIDSQHRYFASLINRLSKELQHDGRTAYQAALLNELAAYARFHFISEENLMHRAGYPELAEHAQHHRELIDRLSARMGKLELDCSTTTSDAIIDFLIDWFIHHTVSEDRKFSDWVVDNDIALDAD